MSTRLIVPAEAMLLVEAAHHGDGDWQSWCRDLFGAASRVFTSPHVNVGIGRRHPDRWEVLGATSVHSEILDYWTMASGLRDPAVFDPFWRFPGYVGTAAETVGAAPIEPELKQFHEAFGSSDILGLVAISQDVSVCIGAPHAERVRIGPSDRRLLTQVALHLEAGLRLRNQPHSAVAWLDINGRVVHAEGAAKERAARNELSVQVAAVERSRTRARRCSVEAVEAWRALIAGRWMLVERDLDRPVRCYVVVEAPMPNRLLAWSKLETHAVELSARGLSGKMVAYALGVSTARVSKLLSSAAVKLGVSSRTEVVRLAARLLNIGPKGDDGSTALTSSEREILALIRLGLTNVAIARERNRSEHTVANQVVSLMQKLRLPSRRALAAADFEGSPAQVD